MKKIVQQEIISYTCDFTGKSIDSCGLEKELNGYFEPSRLYLELNTALKMKLAKRNATDDYEIKQSDLTESQIEYYRNYDQVSHQLDLHPEVAYEVYKFLKRKYPESIVDKIVGEDYEVLDPSKN